ncbi:polysaccharide biosynthesis protein CapD [Thioalkalivibrio sp. K90mix]|uniref:polysaccharide biosynthesis protein n=1 Tax=unclassified Thioalkalivibrio TaxID=2621013 RepID=UPI000195A516|nr:MULTISPECIES: nucleoside-diphosphate sugar epimerase/dehydratase [unclassified Thioalkalivibrio]ADC71120.1 polysaccharide biosynthesis protein CapD [Thioalkalivibrio sp. K90mix]
MAVLDRSLENLLRLPRGKKQGLMVLADIVMLPLALWLAFVIRTGQTVPPMMVEAWWLFALVPAVGALVFARLGLYRTVVRFMGARAVRAVIVGVSALALMIWASAELTQTPGFFGAVAVNFALLAFALVAAGRFVVRSWYQAVSDARTGSERVVIFGAGEAGVQLASGLQSSGRFRVMAFIDEDPAVQGRSIDDIPVCGREALGTLVEQCGVRRVLLAVPSASRADRRRILEWLEPYPLHVQSVPSLEAVVSGRAPLDQLEDLDVADLLGRDPVPPNEALLARSIRGRVVMVTGAGGSIGSELCRRILSLEPAALVLFERNEFALYRIEQEIMQRRLSMQPGVEVHAVLGSVANQARVEEVLHQYGVQTLYHAAAYKHVPLVEGNLLEGLRNNSLGTAVVADAAIAAGVERFILVSTDKAVRPTNVMGASKRLAEMVLQDRARRQNATVFSMVRFGNVLGSSGSVVPLFHRQIREGGPVTVTHPEITRYFMSIPEAAELVIQAGAMAQGGEVYVLDMGEPVRIIDLARRMIRLHGHQVREDEAEGEGIAITCTGLRPGEKLYEELLIGDNVEETPHSKIMRARETCAEPAVLARALRTLEKADRERNAQAAFEVLREVVDGYEPGRDEEAAHSASAPVGRPRPAPAPTVRPAAVAYARVADPVVPR